MRKPLALFCSFAFLAAPARAAPMLLHRFEGAGHLHNFGLAVAGLGDVNGDGTADLLVGAPGYAANAGRATVFSGKDFSVIRNFDGAAAGDQMGYDVKRIGDFDGDGDEDALVSSPGAASLRGRATVFSIASGAVLRTFDGLGAGHYAGSDVAALGDVNGGGKPDFAVLAAFVPGMGGFKGSAYVVSGETGLALHTFEGVPNDGAVDSVIESAGDANGDGKEDLITVRSGFGGGRGRAEVFDGATGASLRVFEGEAPGDGFGETVAGVGDWDGDGKAEIAVGASGRNSEAGRVYVYSVATGALVRGFDGAAPGGRFGFSVSGGTDFDGGGTPDLIVASLFEALPGRPVQSGVVRVFSGETYAAVAEIGGERGATGTEPSLIPPAFGDALGVVGDWNGDGRPELVAGAYQAGASLLDRPGEVSVYALAACAPSGPEVFFNGADDDCDGASPDGGDLGNLLQSVVAGGSAFNAGDVAKGLLAEAAG